MDSLLIGICESSTNDTDLMIQYLKIAEACLSMKLEIRTFSTGKSLLDSYRPVFDILFLNLPVPDVDSKFILEEIRQRDALVNIILTSETNDLFSLGYEYSAKNYLLKPLWYSKILGEIKKHLADESILTKPYIWIYNQQGIYKLYLNKLRYIETSNRKLLLHYENKQICYNGQLADFQKNLSSDFFRCNNSYIVNINYVGQVKPDISRYKIYLVTGEVIPLSRNKKMQLLSKLKNLEDC